ncbi:unnamed protein product [Prunus armeniaca]
MLRGEKSAIPLLYLARVGDPTFHEDAGLIKKQAASNHTLIPANYPLATAAPLLCAGITVYASMVRRKMNQPGKSLGVIGLGGLGHMAVKFGKAFGLDVTIFSTSISKKEEALSQLGADNFVVSSDRNQMKALVKSVDFIIDIASGGTKDIQEMMDFCASNGIHPMIEIIPIQSANEAIERLLKSVVIYGFVIDIENSLK